MKWLRLMPSTPPGADEKVFVVTGHPDDLVRNDLADGQNQIVFAGSDELASCAGHAKSAAPARHLPHKIRRHIADGGDARAPVVDAEQFRRHAGKHFGDLGRRHRRMRAQRGQNVCQAGP